MPITQHSQAGIWVLGLLDFFPCGAVQMYWLLIFQTIAIAWVLGGGRWVQNDRKSFRLQWLWDSVRDVTGVKNLRYFWIVATMIVAPLAILVILMSDPPSNYLPGWLPCHIHPAKWLFCWEPSDRHRRQHPSIFLQRLACRWVDLSGFGNIPKNH